MFYATGVDKIRQNVAKIWDGIPLLKNTFLNSVQKDKHFIIKVESNKSNLNKL